MRCSMCGGPDAAVLDGWSLCEGCQRNITMIGLVVLLVIVAVVVIVKAVA